jgi:hypothetical protein
MYTNVNLAAPVGALTLLGTGFVFFIAGLIFIHAVVTRRVTRAGLLILVAVVIAGAYLGAILLFSFASNETVLTLGQEKHFCEIDCHLAYSIQKVSRFKTLGDPPNQTTAAGLYTTITIRTRFDENTINPRRGNGLLYPNSRTLSVIDEDGREFWPSPAGQTALDRNNKAGTPISAPLRPGESYTTTIVFDLPPDIRDPTLLINEGEWITHFVIGHENSPFHKKTRFQI